MEAATSNEVSTNAAERLHREFALACPRCAGRLTLLANDFRCVGCNAEYRTRNGSVDFVGPYLEYADADRQQWDRLTRDVMRVLSFPPEALASVSEAVADSSRRTGIGYIDAEIASLASRLGLEEERPVEPAVLANRDLGISYIRHYVGAVLPRRQRIQRTVRIRNESRHTISSAAEPPLYMSYHWLDPRGEVVVFDGVRTAFPVDVVAARELSLVMTIETPAEVGDYVLRVLPIEEGKAWHENMRLDVPVRIDEPATERLHQITISPGDKSYADDHADGVAFLDTFVESLNGGARLRILEVGAGVHPQSSQFAAKGHTVVSTDICTNLCQLGSLFFRYVGNDALKETLTFVSCDVSQMPFLPEQFDGVVMFATLHHFPEPEKMLRLLARLVRPAGFVAVLCEPCGPNPAAEEYRKDLRRGINEQMFTLDEYDGIFEESGLTPLRMRLDGGSLKAILGV